MTSITDIPIDDVELFLSSNGFTITDDPYDQIWDLINKNIEYDFYPDSVIDWMIAYNLHQRKVKIPKYKRSKILSMNNTELGKLAKLLTLNNYDREQILNILFYLHLLDEEINVIQYLPNELIVKTLENLTMDEIETSCKSSIQFKNACNSQLGLDLIRSRFGDDTLNTSSFTFDELAFYSRVLPFKKKLSFGYDLEVYYLNDNKLLAFNDEGIVNKILEGHNINQFAFYNPNVIILLTDKGELMSYDINSKKDLGIPAILDKVVGVFNISYYNVHILTATGVSYRYSQGVLNKVNSVDKIVQLYNDYYLLDKGEVYFKSKKINNLPKIKQITEHGYVLADNNSIYYISNDKPIELYVTKDKIKGIFEFTHGIESNEDSKPINRLLILYENGNINNMTVHKKEIDEFYPMSSPKNIIEMITDYGHGSAAALSLNQLYIFEVYRNNILTYNLDEY